MKAVACAAVDLGATSGRVIVGRWSRAGLELREVHRFENGFRSLAGHDYWDLPYLWDEVRRGLERARSEYPGLASVGVDSWAVDHVLVDRVGRPVFPVHAYRDARTGPYSARLAKRGIERIYRLTGVPNYPYNTSLQLQETLSSCPGIARVASRCLFIPDYFNFLLSGRMVNEVSIASHSQLLSLDSTDWSRGALEHFGIPRRWFATPSRSPRRLGPVTGIDGLGGTLSVLVPGHDTACAFAGIPARDDGGDIYLSSGTWSLVGIENQAPLRGPQALAARISNERMGDGSFRPLKSCLGLWLLEQTLRQFGSRPTGAREWKALVARAAALRRPDALIDITDATLFNPPDMRRAIDAQLRRRGLRPPGTLAGYVRLISASLAAGHADAVATIERLSGRKFGRLVVIGGGSKNPLLCQDTADAIGRPVQSYSLEGTAVGNLASQLVALGAVGDLGAVRRRMAASLPGVTYLPRG
jgi:rhamnulokinase